MFYVYVLKSLKNKRFYIGCTNNLERRFLEHNSGKSKYTRLTKPFEFLHSEKFDDLKIARQRELALKSGQGRRWLKEKFSRTVA